MARRLALAALVTLAACGDISTPATRDSKSATPTPSPADPTAGHHQALDTAQAEHDAAVAEREQAERAARERAARATTTTRPPAGAHVEVHPNPPANIATASWYGPGFFGNRTACGQTYTDRIHGTAHRTLPCGTLVTFTNAGRTITVPVIDRGPYIPGRMWDLSHATCQALAHCYTGPIQWRLG